MRNITYTIILVQNQIPTLSQITDMNTNMKLSCEHFLSTELLENSKLKYKFVVNSLKILMCNFSSNPVTENLIIC